MGKPAPVIMSAHLQHPTTGADVHLLGTAALSTKAAQETRELILKLRPDVVVIEADAEYLAALIDAELNGDLAAALARRRATTFVDALGIVFSGQLLPVLYDLTYACFGAVLARNFGLACDHMLDVTSKPRASRAHVQAHALLQSCLLPFSPATNLNK